MPNPQLLLNQANNQLPQLQVKGEFLFINGKEIPYEQQMIRNNLFYIADLGLDLPLLEEVKKFDQNYFCFLLNKQIIKELELHHPAIGLQILEAMPNLTQKNYLAIFWRLSLAKIKKIIMHDPFYLHITKKLASFVASQYQKKIEGLGFIQLSALCNLDSAYKRLLYILDEVDCSQASRQAFYMISYEVVLQIITDQSFQATLIQGFSVSRQPGDRTQSKQKIGLSFLRNTIKVLQTIVSLTKMPQELVQLHNIKNERTLMKVVMNSKVIHLLTVNFQYFFNFDRQNLTKLLALIATQNEQFFWDQIIIKRYQKQKVKPGTNVPCIYVQKAANKENAGSRLFQKSSFRANTSNIREFEQVTNERLFFLLITSNYYEIQQPDWELSESILQSIIKNNAFSAKFMFFKVFSQISSQFMTASVVELVIKFLKNLCKAPQFSRDQIKMFLIEFMGNINAAIFEEFSKFQAKELYKGNLFNKSEQKENLFLQMSFLKIYTTLLELKLFNVFSGLQISKSLSQLMKMTKTKKGVIEGARRTFIHQRNLYTADLKLRYKLGAEVKIKGPSQIADKQTKYTNKPIEELISLLQRID